MLFNSWTFLAFFALVFCVHHIIGSYFSKNARAAASTQCLTLTAASFIFYAWNEPKLALLLGASCFGNVIFVRKIIRNPADKSTLPAAIVYNLLLLFFFKYFGLFARVFLLDFRAENCADAWHQNITLPIGISFFTFQAISLVADLKNTKYQQTLLKDRKLKDYNFKHTLLNISFYISFFPQLIAGPIVKAHDFLPQIRVKKFTDINIKIAVHYLILGYFLKSCVADNLRESTFWLFSEHIDQLGSIDLILLLYSYPLQMYADFYGYSAIAIGLAALLGYRLPINFYYPFLAPTFSEFWARWHISLSSWLRDYLYFPLGGNKKGSGRTLANLFIVMALGGLWHGAELKFIAWGVVHGIFLVIERAIGVHKWPRSRLRITRSIIVFHGFAILLLFFCFPNSSGMISYFQQLFAFESGIKPRILFSLLFFGSPVIIHHLWGILQNRHTAKLPQGLIREQHIDKRPDLNFARQFMLAVMLLLLIINHGSPGEFIYFQF